MRSRLVMSFGSLFGWVAAGEAVFVWIDGGAARRREGSQVDLDFDFDLVSERSGSDGSDAWLVEVEERERECVL